MSAFFGWFAAAVDDASRASRLERMRAALPQPARVGAEDACLSGAALARSGPAVMGSLYRDDTTLTTFIGVPRWSDRTRREEAAAKGDACVFAREVRAHGVAALEQVHDAFAVAYVDAAARTLLLATDRIGTFPVFHARGEPGLVFGTALTAALAFFESRPPVDLQALFHYLTFSSIPSPFTGFDGLRALGPAEYLWRQGSTERQGVYWRPHFRERSSDDSATPAELRNVLGESVARSVASSARQGRPAAFLSGGIDSSSILALMSRTLERAVDAYSLGHDGGNANELPYARLAARAFGAMHHECVLTPTLLVEAMHDVARASGTPCANISAPGLLTLTRRAAADGVTMMVGGDGGDELFAGNESYQLQRVLARWHRVPPAVRRVLLEPVIRALPSTVPLMRRAQGYVRRATIPLPERLLNWTSLRELGAARVVSDEVLSAVNPDAPLALLRATYDDVDAQSELARQLVTDWRFTLHGNDLPRVRIACDLAGIALELPMLADDVVELATRVPAAERMDGTLRTFYKRAFAGILPASILHKRKRGEGIPWENWIQRPGALRDHVREALSSLRGRGIIRPSFLDRIVAHPRFNVDEVPPALLYQLVMMEAWFASHVDRASPPVRSS